MNAWTVILDIVLILISIVLIIAVLLQQGQRQGLGAIAGGAETFFGKNKAKGYEAKMARITKIGAAVFIVAARTAPADTTDAAGDTTYTAEELEHDHDGDGIPDHTAEEHTDETVTDGTATDETTDDTAEEVPAEEAADATEVPATDVTEEPAEATEAPTEAPAAEATEAPAEDAAEEPTEVPAAE